MTDHRAAANQPRIPVPVPESTIDIPDLIVSVELDDDTVSAGDNLHGVAKLSNHGRERIAFVTGPVLGGIALSTALASPGTLPARSRPSALWSILGQAKLASSTSS